MSLLLKKWFYGRKCSKRASIGENKFFQKIFKIGPIKNGQN